MKHKVCDLLVAKPLNCQQIPKKSKKGLGNPIDFDVAGLGGGSPTTSKSIGFPKPFLEFFGIFDEIHCFA